MPHKIVRDYFDFSRRERKGIAALLLLIVLTYCLPYGRAFLLPEREGADTAGFRQAALAVAAMMAQDSAAYAGRYRRDTPVRRYARPWGNLREGGRSQGTYAYAKRDTAGRYYGGPYHRDSSRRFRPRTPVVIDVNAADSAQWEALPGIGPVLARRITGFRERLGGFHSIAQVRETYGLADSVFKKIQGMLRMDAVSLRKIDLNQTDEKSLADHPYINTKLARVIVRYRSSHGPFSRVEDLRGIALVNDSIYRKLEKYLVVK